MNKRLGQASNFAGMKEIILSAWLGLFLVAQARADTALQNAQAALKEQGFYYGEVNGQKSADTVAAVRRFQIRNGLQVTGELNNETIAALSAHRSGEVRNTPPPTVATVPQTASTPAIVRPAPGSAAPPPDYDQPRPLPSDGNAFVGTPLESAPLQSQQRVIVSAQSILRRRGFYRGAVNGVFDSSFGFSLRAFQSNLGLPATGRFDSETLSMLGILPRSQVTGVRRAYPQQPLAGPPVRGVWIREPSWRRDRDDRD